MTEKGEEALLLPQVFEKFKGQYIAARVMERDADGQPLKFKVLVVGTRYTVREHTLKEEDVCIFPVTSIPQEGMEAIL